MFKFVIDHKAPIKSPPAPACEKNIDQRESTRPPTQIAAYLHANGECQATVITDVSIDGAGLDGAIAVFPGDLVEIELINGRRIAGHVIWWLMGSCGIQFATPLSRTDALFSREPTSSP